MKQIHDAHRIFLAQGGCDSVVTIIQTQLHRQHREKQAVEKLYNQNNTIFRTVLEYTLVQIEQIKNSISTKHVFNSLIPWTNHFNTSFH